MRVSNTQYQTRIFSQSLDDFIDPLSSGIRLSDITHDSLRTHKLNCVRMSQRPDSYLPVILDYTPIPPRSSWELKDGKFHQLNKASYRTDQPVTTIKLQQIVSRLARIVNNQIASEVSGGLDTAIVIGMLRSIGIDPCLVGAISDRYEFRTERHIQQTIAKNAQNVHFINEGESLPFAHLLATPAHALPNKSSLFFYLNKVTALWAKAAGQPFVANGIGFDSILIDKIAPPAKTYTFDPRNLDDNWANDYVFRPLNVTYVNVASIHSVQKALVSMRSGLEEDTQKAWARETFRQFIPRELADYRYKASFAAVYDEGLEHAKDDILFICATAHKLTCLDELDPNKIKALIDGFREYDNKAEFEFLARLSFASWVYQLEKAGVLLK